MADLTTTFLGLKLQSPLVISSNPLCAQVENIQKMAAAGAGAVILPSLFEEQLRLEDSGLEWYRTQDGSLMPKSLAQIPDMKAYNHGSGGYLATLYQAKKETNIPIIASLNGSSDGGWIQHAKMLQSVGADAIELNIYYLPTQTYIEGTEIEGRYLRLVEAVKGVVTIPVAVKLNPQFSSLPNMAQKLANAGADGLVLFNRFYQPDFNLETETALPKLSYSQAEELLLRLRWAAILHGRVQTDLGITGGVHTAEDVLKSLYAGANVAMMASAVLLHGLNYIGDVLRDVQKWLDDHQIGSSDEVRGRMSHGRINAPSSLERANYLQTLRSFYDQ